MKIEREKLIKKISKLIEKTRKELGELIPMWLVVLISIADFLNVAIKQSNFGKFKWSYVLENIQSDFEKIIVRLVFGVLIVIWLKRKKKTSIYSIILTVVAISIFLSYCNLLN